MAMGATCSTSPSNCRRWDRPHAARPRCALQLLAKRAALYDKDREEHYNLISALHKSLRGSDPDAGLYWFARMILGGEDPRYIARRLARFAAEDVGLADPTALTAALAAWESYASGWARPRANWRWRNWSCTSPPRPSRTPSTPPEAGTGGGARDRQPGAAAGAYPQRADENDA